MFEYLLNLDLLALFYQSNRKGSAGELRTMLESSGAKSKDVRSKAALD